MTASSSSPVTLRVVAKKAKVALQTASKSLNGDPSVREYLRERVFKAADSLGYRLNPLARAMATRSTKLVTLSIFELENPYYGRLADCLTQELSAIGMGSVFCERTDQVVEFNTGFCASGSILIVPTADDVNRIAAHHPVITIQTQEYCRQVAPDVSLDIESAYRELTQRVLGTSHTRIACNSPSKANDWRGKFGVVKQAMLSAGHQMVVLPDAVLSKPEVLAGYLVEHPGCVDTLFTRNDMDAAKVLVQLHKVGIRVPHDLLLIGCDGVVPLPGVWTAVADVTQLASLAVKGLKRQIDGDRRKELILLPMLLHTPSWRS